ncbi:STAS domain-containing protein [Streptomyces sp. NPDC088789]|uniref:STAS domain-containing protein n=1 Tax=Streptomyces sp. NPDC088789 TaxID=3365899 RepID=UPI0037FDAE96
MEAGSGTACIRLTGPLDYATSDELVQHADQCLTSHPHLQNLRLDCTGLEFCDSMGISALLMIHRKTTTRLVQLHLDHPPPSLERILRITGVAALFSRTHPTSVRNRHTPESAPPEPSL